MAHLDRLTTAHAQLLVVDLQEKLLPHIWGHEEILTQTVRMMRVAAELELPITYSEQYPQGLGKTVPNVLEAASNASYVAKEHFSVCGSSEACDQLASLLRPQVLLVGIETHVCIQQTAFDLLTMQMRPYVLVDAVSSRHAIDHQTALERMRGAGIVVTTVESAIYELLGRAGTERFKRVLPLVRER